VTNISVLAKAFRLIELLILDGEMRLGEISRKLGFPKTTVYRILVTLENLGYAKQNPLSQSWRGTIKFFEVGSKLVSSSFVEIAKPSMIELANKTGETINLGVLDGIHVVCLHKVESKQHLKLDLQIGNRQIAYCTSYGKALLAFIPAEERSRLLSENPIVTLTKASLRTSAAIEQDLEEVRKRGYAIDNEEGSEGVCCVGAPIFDKNKTVIAGLSIAGPSLRIKPRLDEFGKLVRETADSISKAITFS
jgi:DNA-binding IclR family transcriptional regulator